MRVVFLTHNFPRWPGDVSGNFLVPLAHGLKRRGVYAPQAGWGRFLLRLFLALVIFAGALWWVQLQIDWTALQSAPWWRAGVLGGVIGAAIALYFIVLLAFGFRLRDFRHERRA